MGDARRRAPRTAPRVALLLAVDVSAGEVALAVVNMLQVVFLAYLGSRTRQVVKNTNGHDEEPSDGR